jgi:hypothetical protein
VKREKNGMIQRILKGIKNPGRAINRIANKLSSLTASASAIQDVEGFVGIPENRSQSEYGDYVSFVTKAAIDRGAFSKFKSHPSYRAVLEHVTPQEGAEYLAIIEKQNPEFME